MFFLKDNIFESIFKIKNNIHTNSEYDLNIHRFNTYIKKKWFVWLYISHFIIFIIYRVISAIKFKKKILLLFENIDIIISIFYLLYMSFLLYLFTSISVTILYTSASTLMCFILYFKVESFLLKSIAKFPDHFDALDNINYATCALLPAVFIEIMILIYIVFKFYKVEKYFNVYYAKFAIILTILILITYYSRYIIKFINKKFIDKKIKL